jgi:hypothetical protein
MEMMGSSHGHSQEATYYRTALLLGLIRGEVVHAWAHHVIEQETDPQQPFFEIVSVSADNLSGLRDALSPLAMEPEPPATLEAILGLLYKELASGVRGHADTLTIVRQMRSMLRLPQTLYAALNAALVAQAQDPQGTALVSWLQDFAPSDASKLRTR